MKRLTVLSIILVIAGFVGVSQQQSNATSLPPGNWTLSCAPSKTRGEVVDLYTVSTDASKGLTVTEVSLENRSSQDVAAVKIGWKLYERSQRQAILLSGETPDFLGVSLSPGEKRVITFPVLSFARIYRPLLRGGKLEGHYRIELWVSDVKFDTPNPPRSAAQANFFTTTADANRNVRMLKVISRPAPLKTDAGCQHQECGWSQQDHCEKCFGENGSTCAWSDCTHCASGRCPAEIE